MVRIDRITIAFILFFFLSMFVFSQDKQVNEDKDKKLREEILAVYQSKGDKGLRDFIKKKKDKITNKFIENFARTAMKERKEKWLKICLILAEEKKDEKTLADVFLRMGEYFRLISDNKEAIDYFDKALLIYVKLNDPVGQGNIYHLMGNIYLLVGENSKALVMYDKALTFFEKAEEPLGQGYVYMWKGDIYFNFGENSKSLEMYDKALRFFKKARAFGGNGNVYLRKGNIYLKIGENSKALEMFDKALTLFKKVRDFLGQANVYISKGDIFFYTTHDYSRALKLYDKALTFFEKVRDPSGQGNAYRSKGAIYFYTGDNSIAIEMYDKALHCFLKSGDILGQGNVYVDKGNIYLRIGDNIKTLEMYDKALLFFEKAGDILGQGNVYYMKGGIYLTSGDRSKALGMYEKALSCFRKKEYLQGQGLVYMGKGDIYRIIGDNSKAFEMYKKSLFLFDKAKSPNGQGSVYLRKGEIYLRIGNNLKALEMYNEALTIFREAGTPKGQGDVYRAKGDIFYNTGNNVKALQMYNNALSFFEKAGEALGEGNVYYKMGNIYLYMGDNSKAHKMYDEALPLLKKVEDTIGQGNIYCSKGDICLRTGDTSRGFEMYNKSMSFFEKAGEPSGKSNIFRRKGDIYFALEDNPKAFEMYDKAIHFCTEGGNTGELSNSLFGKAKVLAKLGKKDEALDLLEKGIANLEKVRTQTAFSELKKTFLEKVYNQYEDTVLYMLDNKYYDKGFKYADSMKARVFLDRMGEELVALEKGLKPELREERGKLVAKLSNLSKVIYETSAKKEEKLEELKKKYRKAQDEFEDLLIKIKIDNPLYASIRYPQPISVYSLQKEVLKRREILVRYFITPDKAYVFLVSKKRFNVVPLDVKAEKIKSHVNRWLSAVKSSNTREMELYGKLLYRGLFKPIEAKLKGTRDIIIIPDRHLEKIPFESFILGEEKSGRPLFLLEKYRIKYIQSASLLSLLRKYYQRNRETNNFIGFGDPVYDYDNFKQGKMEKGTQSRISEKANEIKEIFRSRYARVGGLMNRLQGSGEEVRTIARLFESKSQKSLIHLREQATEDNAKAPNLKEFGYIHFACHGILENEFQCLALSQLPEAQSSEDGYFTLNEIMNCDYNAKLVVLSACRTGSGKMERAEGVTGLTRAVMYAGTPAVVACLWDVDDPATKELMVMFYRNMLEKNMHKAEALMQAKLEMIKNSKYSSPLFWSAFVMYGE